MIGFFQEMRKGRLLSVVCLFWILDATAVESQEIILRNAPAEVVVRPDIGRILSFKRVGGSNVLWVADNPQPAPSGAVSYGGLRLMISPEVLWYQIRSPRRSDPATDGGSWTVLSQDARSVTLRAVSGDMGAEIVWSIHLHERHAELTLAYRIERISENPFPLHLWSIAQVPLAGEVYLSRIPFVSEGYRNCLWTKGLESHIDIFPEPEPEPEALRFRAKGRPEPMKIGTFGRWIAHVNQGSAFVICTEDPVRLPYIESSNLQLFAFPGEAPFYELEATSPMHMLRPGEHFQTVEKWVLMDMPEPDAAQIAAAINARVSDGRSAVGSKGEN